jgi:4-amino-4-deoxy-L-arabinose transferase-like glycosyltransferase
MKRLWNHYSIRLILFASVLYGIIFSVNGLVMGGDSNWYLKLAQGVAHRDFSTFGQFPFHYLYAVILSAGYLLTPDHAIGFATVINVAILIALPLLSYHISLKLTGNRRLSYLAGVAIMFQVEFIFWALFVLSDVLFLVLLATFILCVLRATRGGRSWVTLVVVSVLLLFARPTALVALPVGWLYVAYHVHRPSFHHRLVVMLSVVIGVVLLLIGSWSLHLPTVYQSLWLSTRVATNNVNEITEAFKFDLPVGVTEQEYKLEQFREFIIQHPVKYTVMCLQRFVAFWHPWVWGAWSSAHRAIELVYSLFLTAVAIYAVISRSLRREKWLLLSLAFGFSLLTVFGQIDSDIRYRLPSELSVLLLVPVIVASWVGKHSWQGKLAKIFN